MLPDIKQALKDWGYAVQNRYAVSRSERPTHVLQAVRDQAPGTVENTMRALIGRGGRDRRTFMAERSGVKGMRIVPAYAVDPVRSSNDADRPHDNPEIPVDMGIPDHLRWIDRLVGVMEQRRPVMAACVREEYCTAGSQDAKARRVRERAGLGEKFSKWNYRDELDRAIVWIEGFAAAA